MANFVKYYPENVRIMISVDPDQYDTITLVSIEFRTSNLNSWTECGCLSFVGLEKCVDTHCVFDTMNINQLVYISLANSLANAIHEQNMSNINIDGLEKV